METLKPIAHIQSDFTSKFGIPRQSNIVKGLKASVVFVPEYRNMDAVRGLEDFSHIWLIWGFSAAGQGDFLPTVRPPRLGGNVRMGVFATRSPYRPNPLGLSSVQLEGVEKHPELGPVLHVLGADLMDGTPIYDIKPYLPHVDCHPAASAGFAAVPPGPVLRVVLEERWLRLLPEETGRVLKEVLAQDPRPPYQNDPGRIYGMEFAGFEVKFAVEEDVLTVVEIEQNK